MVPRASFEPSPGATTLLTIALENDSKQQLCRNYAFVTSLEFVRELPATLRARSVTGLLRKIDAPTAVDSFLGFCAAILNFIDREVESAKPVGNEWTAVSDFDHGVYLALAQTLSETTQAKTREKGLEPNLDEAIQRLGEVTPAVLQELLIKNYLGNLLQDTFDACKVRLNVPGLPEDTEQNLRQEDAAGIAAALRPELPSKGRPGAELGNRLDQMLRVLARAKPSP